MKVFPIEEARKLICDEAFAEHIADKIKASTKEGYSVYSECFDGTFQRKQINVIKKYQDAGYNIEWYIRRDTHKVQVESGWDTLICTGVRSTIKISW